MHAIRYLLPILLAACATAEGPTSVEDLGALEAREISVPLDLAPGETRELVLEARGMFELVATYDEPADINVVATAGAAEFATLGQAPTLVVRGEEAASSYSLLVRNISGTTAIKGTFRVQRPAATRCQDRTWTAWFKSLTTELDRADGHIDTSERRAIAAILDNQPCDATSDVAYAIWHDQFDALLANHGKLDGDARDHLKILLGVVPQATGEGAYATWSAGFEQHLTASGDAIDDDEREHLEARLLARPATPAAQAYLAWLPAFEQQLTSTHGVIDEDMQHILDLRVRARPIVVDDRAYVEWAKIVERLLLDTTGYFDSNQLVVLGQALRVKPCATGVAARDAWSRISTSAPRELQRVLAPAQPTASCP